MLTIFRVISLHDFFSNGLGLPPPPHPRERQEGERERERQGRQRGVAGREGKGERRVCGER